MGLDQLAPRRAVEAGCRSKNAGTGRLESRFTTGATTTSRADAEGGIDYRLLARRGSHLVDKKQLQPARGGEIDLRVQGRRSMLPAVSQGSA